MKREFSTTRKATNAARIGWAGVLLCLLAGTSHQTHAQTAWEYSPYDVRVRVAVGDDPRLASLWPRALTETLVDPSGSDRTNPADQLRAHLLDVRLEKPTQRSHHSRCQDEGTSHTGYQDAGPQQPVRDYISDLTA